MECPRCGTESDDKSKFCKVCGITLIAGGAVTKSRGSSVAMVKPAAGPPIPDTDYFADSAAGEASVNTAPASMSEPSITGTDDFSFPEMNSSVAPLPQSASGSHEQESYQYAPAAGVRDPYSSPYGMDDFAPQIEYAGFWRRFGAYLIDCFILGLTIAIFSFTSTIVLARGSSVALPFLLLLILILLFYFPVMESGERQATYGKRLMGIYVTDLYGERISFWRALGRLFARILSGIFYIGYLIQPFMEKKQALHDLIAGTLVVRYPEH